MNNTLLETVNITKTFNKIPYLNRVSVSINRGEFLIIAGCNGSGKTLLMKHLNGIYPIKKGTIFFNGEDCYKKEKLMKKRIGIIFQNPDTQIIGLTVYDDIAFGPKNLGYSKDKISNTVKRVMENMEITHLRDRNPHTLSGGEKKRVTIAGILAMNPEIIIFDEPFIGLDYPGVISVTKSLIKLKEQGETVVVITHDLEKVLKYSERMIILSKGEVVSQGKAENLLNDLEKWGIRRPVQDSVEEMTWLK